MNYYTMEKTLNRKVIIDRINKVKPYINVSAICRELGLHKQSVNTTLKSNGVKCECSIEDLKEIADFLDVL